MIIKKIIPICVCAILFCGCHQSKEEIVYDLINAENNYNLKEVDQFLTDNFMRYGTDTLNKEEYLDRLKNLKPIESKASILSIQNFDSVIKTEEQICNIVDSLLGITPYIVQKRTVTIVDAIFGFPFATSYELDEDIVKISTDQSDLLFEIEDSKTLVGEGFARGTFIKVD